MISVKIMSIDTSIKSRESKYNRLRSGFQQKNETVRVFRTMPERVALQIRNPKHYMTASLDAEQTKALIEALQANLAEII